VGHEGVFAWCAGDSLLKPWSNLGGLRPNQGLVLVLLLPHMHWWFEARRVGHERFASVGAVWRCV
jgi:hypothetical protein